MKYGWVAALLVTTLGGATMAVADQGTSICGTIRDSNGAPLPAVRVTLADREATSTNSQGDYCLSATEGVHVITAVRLGLRGGSRTVEVRAGQSVRVDFMLSYGQVGEEVTITD